MNLFPWRRRQSVDEDIDEEIRSHLAMATRDLVVDGADPRAARLAALKEFGNVAHAREAARSVWSTWWLDAAGDMFSDVRYALRRLVKAPGFSLIVIAVLALGIGLNAAVFTIFRNLALKPLTGVADSGSLTVVLSRTSDDMVPISYHDYQYLRDHAPAFTDLTGSTLGNLSLGLGNRGERVAGEFVTGNYFQMLGVGAQVGRTILPADEGARGAAPFVVLSDSIWRRAFGSDPGVVGRTIHVNAFPLTVIGVAAPGFHGTVVSFDIELFLPVTMVTDVGGAFDDGDVDRLSERTAPLLMVLGRRASGISTAQASAQVEVLGAQLAAEIPNHTVKQRVVALPIWQSPYGAQTYMLPAVIGLGAMGGVFLLIVSANIAGLVLVRGLTRRGEIAVRLALGASRFRILRLLFIENLVVAVPGAVVGLLVTWRVLPFLWGRGAANAPVQIYFDMSFDSSVVLYAALTACASAVCFGFIPALRMSQVDLADVMKDTGSPRNAARGRFRAALVVSQVAASVLLLVGAGLVSRSLDAARRADTGFDAGNTTSVTLNLKPNGYDEPGGRRFYEQLLDRVRADQGVEAASLAVTYPMTLVESGSRAVVIEGDEPPSGEDRRFLFNIVSPDYFRTLRIALVSGREFDVRDDGSTEQVAIVNQTLADRFWGGATAALGKRVRVEDRQWRTIVGVAHDVKYARVNEDPRPYVYLPFLQVYTPAMLLHTRGPGGSPALLEQARRHIAALDPNLPILDAKSLADQTSAALSIFELMAQTLLIFGASAMALAAMGIYGLVSYTVRQSTHEIGIRMALGAQSITVIRRFARRGLQLGVVGAVLGAAASLAVTRLLTTLLFGVSATDPVSFATAGAVVLGSALIATLVPAWRAARINPIVALRHQ